MSCADGQLKHSNWINAIFQCSTFYAFELFLFLVLGHLRAHLFARKNREHFFLMKNMSLNVVLPST